MQGTNVKKSTEIETGMGAGQTPVALRTSCKTAIVNKKSAMLLFNQARSAVPPFETTVLFNAILLTGGPLPAHISLFLVRI